MFHIYIYIHKSPNVKAASKRTNLNLNFTTVSARVWTCQHKCSAFNCCTQMEMIWNGVHTDFVKEKSSQMFHFSLLRHFIFWHRWSPFSEIILPLSYVLILNNSLKDFFFFKFHDFSIWGKWLKLFTVCSVWNLQQSMFKFQHNSTFIQRSKCILAQYVNAKKLPKTMGH
jgi:hypothetical protein